MSYPTHDTDWAESALGNDWKRIDGKVLIVGRSRLDGAFWARADDHLVRGSFPDKSAAKAAAEAELRRQTNKGWY